MKENNENNEITVEDIMYASDILRVEINYDTAEKLLKKINNNKIKNGSIETIKNILQELPEWKNLNTR